MKNTIRGLMISGLVALLAACGGGGGSDDPAGDAVLRSGIYGGSWTASDASSGNFVTFISGNEAHALSDDDTRMNVTFSVSGSAVTGNGRYYYENGSTIIKGTVSATGTVSDTTLTLTLTRSDGIVNNVVFVRIPALSDESASFDKLAGSYKTADQSADITFSDIGAITGSDNDGCQYSGDVEIPDAAVNVYKVHLDVADCAYSGAYTGLAARDKSDGSIGVMFGNTTRLAGADLYK